MLESLLPAGAVLPALFDALSRARIGAVALINRSSSFLKLYINEPAATALGYTPSEWLALPMFGAIDPDQRQTIAQLYERLANDAPMPPAIELTLVHREGHRVRGEFAIGMCDVPDGRALVLVTRGISATPQTLSLIEADRLALIGALAAGFAHETNNPLTSVLLTLRSLRKQVFANLTDAAQANALRCLDDVTSGAERIASNVRALQTLASRSAAKPIDLATLVSSALRLAAPTLQPRAHLIRQIVPVPHVLGEESRLGQAVLTMLLFSSSGFVGELVSRDAPQGANRIVVAVEQRGPVVVVEISDNGSPLTPAEVEHAFDPFFRSPVRGGGVGVGLGIARSIASTLAGEVTLAPREGGGAMITMALPVAAKEPPA